MSTPVKSTTALLKSIVKAIKAGNHETRYIVEACKAELSYYNFCQALALLQQEGKIIYKSGLGYYLA